MISKEFTGLIDALGQHIIGKPQQLALAIACLLARGHLLIEDLPGMGKTTLLLRLEYEIHSQPELSHLIPIRFTEEQYNIVSLCNLWEVVADSLEEIEGFEGIVEQVESAIDEDRDNCFHIIKTALEKNGKNQDLIGVKSIISCIFTFQKG